MPSEPDTKNRTLLPIPDRPFTGLVTFGAKDPKRSGWERFL